MIVAYTCRKQDDKMIIRVSGRLDSTESPGLYALCMEQIQAGERQFIFDLSYLDSLSSAGLRVLLEAVKKVKPDGGFVVLCEMTPMVKELVFLSGMDSFLTLRETLDEALQT